LPLLILLTECELDLQLDSTVEWLDEPQMNPLPQVFKPHTHKLYILRHCTYIVDIDYFDASFVIIIQGPGWVFNATFSNISAISWRQVLVVEQAGVSGEIRRPWARNW
jgi:hypothetical protein